jgi:hypothetical protein
MLIRLRMFSSSLTAADTAAAVVVDTEVAVVAVRSKSPVFKAEYPAHSRSSTSFYQATEVVVADTAAVAVVDTVVGSVVVVDTEVGIYFRLA